MTNRLQLMGNDVQAALAASMATGIVVLEFLIFGTGRRGSLLVVGSPDQLCDYPEDQDLSYLLDCCAPYCLSAMLYVMFF